MAKVRPHKIVTPRIIQPEDKNRRHWFVVLLVMLLMLGLGWQAYEYGRKHAGFDSTREAERQAAMQLRMEALEKEKQTLVLQVAKHQRAAQIDRDAALKAQAAIRDLQDERAALSQEVAFLKGLISEGGSGLYVKEWLLESTEKERSFRYSFTVSRIQTKVRTTKGTVTLSVAGAQGGDKEEITLKMLTDGEVSSHKLGFKHFQDITGVITLPELFEPETVRIHIQTSDGKDKATVKSFDWMVNKQE